MSDPANDYLLVINTLDIPDDACSGFQPSLTMIMANIAAKCARKREETENSKRFHDEFTDWLWQDSYDRMRNSAAKVAVN